MKLVIAIVQDEDAKDLIEELTENKYMVTKLATTGGFLKEGNTTLMTGIEEKEVDNVISIIKDVCKKRKELFVPPSSLDAGDTSSYINQFPVQIKVGGATVFVVDIDKYIKI